MIILGALSADAYARSIEEIESTMNGVKRELARYEAVEGTSYSYTGFFKRDPMRPLLDKDGNLIASNADLSELYLTGIVWSAERPIAFINDIVCQEGDFIGSKQVLTIEKDRVIVKDGAREHVLQLK